MQNKTSQKAFTLIELLIVIAIIGILAVALLPNVLGAPATARDAGRKTELNSVAAALEQYKASNSDYPDSDAGCLPDGVAQYLKGNVLPAQGKSSVLGCSTASAVGYCKLSANTAGYSYIIAYGMENPGSGKNYLPAAVSACNNTTLNAPGATPNDATLQAASDAQTKVYYMMQ